MIKVFISGPMNGYKDYNRKAFNEAEEKLKSFGYSVFNPAWLDVDTESWSRDDILAIDIAALGRCDAIYMLPGWENSLGAQLEHLYALNTDKCELIIDQVKGFSKEIGLLCKIR